MQAVWRSSEIAVFVLRSRLTRECFCSSASASASALCEQESTMFNGGPQVSTLSTFRYSLCFSALYALVSSSSLIARYLAWLMRRQPPSIGSILRPSATLVRLSGSGARNSLMAVLQASTETRASLARPGMEAQTRPRLSAIASIVIQTTRVSLGLHQTVEAVIEENSLVNVTDIVPQE